MVNPSPTYICLTCGKHCFGKQCRECYLKGKGRSLARQKADRRTTRRYKQRGK